MASLPFKSGTKAQFDSLPIKDNNIIYWIADTQELYKGNILYGTGRDATLEQSGLMSAEDKQLLEKIKEYYENQINNDSFADNPAVMDLYSLNNPEIFMPAIASDIMTLEEGQDEEWNGQAYSGIVIDSNYPWYECYQDSRYSTIDENKNIIFDNGQINISEENNAQFIPFQMKRYYDGIDLTEMTLSILYVRPDNQKGTGKIVNVSYDTESINFAWLIDEYVTSVVGSIRFEIHAIGSLQCDEESTPIPYLWKSKIGSGINVISSLFATDTIDIDENWQEEIIKTAIATTEKYTADIVDEYWEAKKPLVEEEIEQAVTDNIDNIEATVEKKVEESVNTAIGEEFSKFNNTVDDRHVLTLYYATEAINL